jgi:hypothetical protein
MRVASNVLLCHRGKWIMFFREGLGWDVGALSSEPSCLQCITVDGNYDFGKTKYQVHQIIEKYPMYSVRLKLSRKLNAVKSSWAITLWKWRYVSTLLMEVDKVAETLDRTSTPTLLIIRKDFITAISLSIPFLINQNGMFRNSSCMELPLHSPTFWESSDLISYVWTYSRYDIALRQFLVASCCGVNTPLGNIFVINYIGRCVDWLSKYVLSVYVLWAVYVTPGSTALRDKLIARPASHEIPQSLLPCSQEPVNDPRPDPGEINMLILFKEIIPVYRANHTGPTSTKCGIVDC